MSLPKNHSPNNAPHAGCQREICGILGADDLCPYCRAHTSPAPPALSPAEVRQRDARRARRRRRRRMRRLILYTLAEQLPEAVAAILEESAR